MNGLIQWVTGHPARAFLAAGLAALIAQFALPIAAWLPASVIVLALLTGGTMLAVPAALGGVVMSTWVFTSAYGLGPFPALTLSVAILLPSILAAYLLNKSHSLSLVFQAVTIGAGALLLAIHAVLDDPLGALAPLIAKMQPQLKQMAEVMSESGVKISAQELGIVTARIAWPVLAWLVLLHAMLAQFAGLWAFGKLREPGIFGREFRQLRLGRVVAWIAVAALAVSLGAQYVFGSILPAADDLLFVLAAAYLLQAFAVVHGLRELQVIGLLPVILAYMAALIQPTVLVLVGIGFADTWVRFRERYGRKPDGATP